MSNLTSLRKLRKTITKKIGLQRHKDYNSLFPINLLLSLVVSININSTDFSAKL
jgi:hypothetical protein